MRRFLVMSARIERSDVQPENLLAFCCGNHLSLFHEAYMVGLECWPVQSKGQEIDGQPSRPIDLIKSGHFEHLGRKAHLDFSADWFANGMIHLADFLGS